MFMKFINHYKKLLQAVNLAFSWLVKRIFAKICALMIKAQKHLKSSYKAKTLNL